MTATTSSFDALFEGGPFPHFEKSLGLFRPVGRRVGPRAVVCLLIGWFPLVVLVVAGELSGGPSTLSFVSDYGLHARSLIGAPLFVLCELFTLKRLEQIVAYFVFAGIIPNQEQPRFKKLIQSTKSLSNSTTVEVIAIATAFLIAFMLYRNVKVDAIPAWYFIDATARIPSAGGKWYAFISVPLLVLLFLSWIWRLLLWGRFLFHVSRMKLQLIAAHPDRAGGLKFLNESIFGFMPVSFTLGLIVAGAAANRIAYEGATLEGLQKTLIGLLIAVMLLFVGPSMVFVFTLHSQKVKGILRYGQLADAVGRQFERKWFTQDKIRADALEAPDFSATTDLYGVAANVYNMTVLPFEIKALVYLAIATLLPFVPVLAMTLSFREFIQELASLMI